MVVWNYRISVIIFCHPEPLTRDAINHGHGKRINKNQ